MENENNHQKLEHRFEGDEILDDLLRRSGCEHTTEDLRYEFDAALEEGTAPGEVIALLWDGDPKFESPEMARRTFSNLFGLYDEMAKQTAFFDLTGGEEPDPNAPLSAIEVEKIAHRVEEMPAKDKKRLYNRFDNRAADAMAFLFETLKSLGDDAVAAASEIAFEIWAILYEHRGESKSEPSLEELMALHAVRGELYEPSEPALAGLVHCLIYERAADEPLSDESLLQIEMALTTYLRALAPHAEESTAE